MRQNSAAMISTLMRMFARPSRLGLPSSSRPQKTYIKFALLGLFLVPLNYPLRLAPQQAAAKMPFGIAWRVIGTWKIQEEPHSLSDGDAIAPGSLLEPQGSAHDHSITILLPDGQRILYECFTSRDCARGFRVPAFYRKPAATAVDLLARVNSVSRRRASGDEKAENREEPSIPRDEAVVLIDSDNKAEIAGLAAALSNGTYSYVVRSLAQVSRVQSRREVEKLGRSISLTLPADGLFEISIADHSNTPRIDLLLAAVRPPRGARIADAFQDIKALLADWNEDYQGWPVHDFQRYYLESVLLGVQPSRLGVNKLSSGKKVGSGDVTAEPIFSPIPGMFHADTEVTLRSATAGAVIRYTVDGSQPLDAATVYHAPIIVKGTALTIKAFASAKGKKDSTVVTGIFRIGD
jgi:hypothetical protein